MFLTTFPVDASSVGLADDLWLAVLLFEVRLKLCKLKRLGVEPVEVSLLDEVSSGLFDLKRLNWWTGDVLELLLDEGCFGLTSEMGNCFEKLKISLIK